jgi:flagellar biosynthetic protein FliP
VSATTRQFARHYVEMVAVMFLGMAVLGLPAEWAMSAFGTGWSQLHDDAPAAALLLMAVTMTAPMAGWMAYRGHSLRANIEMSASMVLPTFGVIGLLWAGLVTGTGTLMVVEHVAMLACMLGAMLLRAAEYTHLCHSAAEAAA